MFNWSAYEEFKKRVKAAHFLNPMTEAMGLDIISGENSEKTMNEHLGDIYAKQRNFSDAREAWLRSLELDPSNEKLLHRFQEQGMGDPTKEDRIQQAKRRVSEKIQSQHATP